MMGCSSPVCRKARGMRSDTSIFSIPKGTLGISDRRLIGSLLSLLTLAFRHYLKTHPCTDDSARVVKRSFSRPTTTRTRCIPPHSQNCAVCLLHCRWLLNGL